MRIHCAALIIVAVLASSALGHPGHGSTPASSTSTAKPTAEKIQFAWGMVAVAFVGTLIGACLPMLDLITVRYSAIAPERRSWFQRTYLGSVAHVRSYTFMSACLSFSAGVLLFGALGLIIPGTIKLMTADLGRYASITSFGLWIAGMALLWSINWLSSLFIPSSSHLNACPCHGPAALSNAAAVITAQASSSSTLQKDTVEVVNDCGKSSIVVVDSSDDPSPSPTPSDTTLHENHQQTQQNDPNSSIISSSDMSKLKEIGILTSLSLAIHKIPEGIVTSAAALVTPTFGVLLAIAMLLHNIPESMAISIPIYASTNSVALGFIAATLVGLVQPIGAAISYGVFTKSTVMCRPC